MRRFFTQFFILFNILVNDFFTISCFFASLCLGCKCGLYMSQKNFFPHNKIYCFYIQAMVSHGRVELLAHPLSQKYLQMKWNSYGKYFALANLLFYSIFLFFITMYSSQLMQNGNKTVVKVLTQDILFALILSLLDFKIFLLRFFFRDQ